MRLLSFLSTRHFTHRIFCFVLGVFVGLQMYGALWPAGQGKNNDDLSQSRSPFRYFSNMGNDNPTLSLPAGPTDYELLHLNITENKDKAFKTLLSLNSAQKIRNGEKFPLTLHNDSVVILVQVHRRIEDLGMMIESMKAARYINETLVIFSHDVYSREIFDLIHSIDFCPVLQLFYPYAIQFYNTSFPGDSPKDCTRDIGKVKALETGCYNAKYPDLHGHYREGRFTQIKHHWVWKQHFLFDRIRVLKDFNGTVLRLDDDYYLAEDTVHVIRTLNDVKPVACPSCLMYILGEHEKLRQSSYVGDTGQAVLSNYFTGIGRGMAFKRDFWNTFKPCASAFCKFDDYNWDWALEHAARVCFKELKVLKVSAGRIFHIGTCQGFHRNVQNCDKQRVKSEIQEVLSKYKHNLYPKTLKVSSNKARIRNLTGYGGWADPRDMELCTRFFNNGTEGDEALREINKIISV